MRGRRFRHRSLHCPSWCEVDHVVDVDMDGTRLHSHRVSSTVDVLVTDDLEAGTRGPTEVVVRAVELSTPAAARALALAVLDAADLLGDER